MTPLPFKAVGYYSLSVLIFTSFRALKSSSQMRKLRRRERNLPKGMWQVYGRIKAEAQASSASPGVL